MDCYDGEVIHEGWIVKSPPQEKFYGYPMIKKVWFTIVEPLTIAKYIKYLEYFS